MSLIIPPGDSKAISFNDDSSPHTHSTSGLKVSVDAQVLPENSLDWYYRILLACQNVTGELKSTEVWSRFQAVSGENRDRIWDGLSKVRIHIADPRPYRQSFEEILSSVLRTSEPQKFIQRQIMAGDPYAKWLSQYEQQFMAENILADSMGARVHRLSRFVGDIPAYPQVTSDVNETEDGLTLNAFGTDLKPIVRKATIFAAKSAATFHDALDAFLEEDEAQRYFPDFHTRRRMESRVLKSHAFDKGDKQQLEVLEVTRAGILSNLQRYPEGPRRRRIAPYSEAESKESYLVQAADIAAGIASKIIETEHIVAVLSKFEYVTYNGWRISMSEAEEIVRKMNRR